MTAAMDVLKTHLKKVQEHADRLYDLVQASNPEAKIYRSNGIYTDQDKRLQSAMWHGHEVSKYLRAAGYNIEKQEKAGDE